MAWNECSDKSTFRRYPASWTAHGLGLIQKNIIAREKRELKVLFPLRIRITAFAGITLTDNNLNYLFPGNNFSPNSVEFFIDVNFAMEDF
jgi:hypothetical protein